MAAKKKTPKRKAAKKTAKRKATKPKVTPLLEGQVMRHFTRVDRTVPGVLLSASRISDDVFGDKRTADHDARTRTALSRLRRAGKIQSVASMHGAFGETVYKVTQSAPKVKAAPKRKKKPSTPLSRALGRMRSRPR